jgi:hypothetical protein
MRNRPKDCLFLVVRLKRAVSVRSAEEDNDEEDDDEEER